MKRSWKRLLLYATAFVFCLISVVLQIDIGGVFYAIVMGVLAIGNLYFFVCELRRK